MCYSKLLIWIGQKMFMQIAVSLALPFYKNPVGALAEINIIIVVLFSSYFG